MSKIHVTEVNIDIKFRVNPNRGNANRNPASIPNFDGLPTTPTPPPSTQLPSQRLSLAARGHFSS